MAEEGEQHEFIRHEHPSGQFQPISAIHQIRSVSVPPYLCQQLQRQHLRPTTTTMARNTIPEGAERTPIHLGEHLLTPGYGAEIQLKIPATIEGPKSSHTSRGRLWLTDERVSSAVAASVGVPSPRLCVFVARAGTEGRGNAEQATPTSIRADSSSYSSPTSRGTMTISSAGTSTRNCTRLSSPTYILYFHQCV